MKVNTVYHIFQTIAKLLRRDNENAPFKILTPCGTCQERLVYWGSNVNVAVTNKDNDFLFKTLKELQPYHWLDAYRDR